MRGLLRPQSSSICRPRELLLECSVTVSYCLVRFCWPFAFVTLSKGSNCGVFVDTYLRWTNASKSCSIISTSTPRASRERKPPLYKFRSSIYISFDRTRSPMDIGSPKLTLTVPHDGMADMQPPCLQRTLVAPAN